MRVFKLRLEGLRIPPRETPEACFREYGKRLWV